MSSGEIASRLEYEIHDLDLASSVGAASKARANAALRLGLEPLQRVGLELRLDEQRACKT